MRSPARVRLAAMALFGVTAGSAWPAIAAEPAGAPGDSRRIVISVSASLMRPGDAAVRDFYGGTQTEFGVDCEIQVRGALDVFVGGRFGSARGSTMVLPPQVIEESYEIELMNRSLQIGAALSTGRGTRARLRWMAGAGLAIGSYEERWPAVGDPVRGSSLGIVGRGGVHYDLTKLLGLTSRLEWSSLRARDTAPDGRKPNLGGVGLSLGMSIRF